MFGCFLMILLLVLDCFLVAGFFSLMIICGKDLPLARVTLASFVSFRDFLSQKQQLPKNPLFKPCF